MTMNDRELICYFERERVASNEGNGEAMATIDEMTESQKMQLSTLLGVVVGAAIDLGVTPGQLAQVFSLKNIEMAAEVVGRKKLNDRGPV